MEKAFLSLGSNLGNRYDHILKAIELIRLLRLTKVSATSPIYETAPIEAKDHPPYLNCAVRIETDLTPAKLLLECEHLEVSMGRMFKGRTSPRIIDVDILLFGRQTVDLPDLKIPHKRMKSRAFMIRPLLDIEPGLCCPLSNESYSELYTTYLLNQKIELYEGQNS